MPLSIQTQEKRDLHKWLKKFELLVRLHQVNGHCRVPDSATVLKRWVSEQRKNRDQLSLDQLERLSSIQFAWDWRDDHWHEFLASVKALVKTGDSGEVGNALVRREIEQKMSKIRRLRRDGKLSDKQIEDLNAIDFEWEPAGWKRAQNKLWENFVRAINVYVDESTSRLNFEAANDRKLAQKMTKIRTLNRRGELDDNKIQFLNSIGFEWQPNPWRPRSKKLWDEFLNEVSRYIQPENGKLNFLPAFDPRLAVKINYIRVLRRRGQMEAHKIQAMDAIGFEWEPITSKLISIPQRFEDFFYRHGHFDFIEARDDPESLELGQLAWTLRGSYDVGKISSDLKQSLDDIKFPWKGYDYRWDNMLDKIKTHMEDEEIIPPELKVWWRRQRRLVREGELNVQRCRKLKALPWLNPTDFHWHLKLDELNATEKKLGKLTDDQIAWLKWHPSRKDMVKELSKQVKSEIFLFVDKYASPATKGIKQKKTKSLRSTFEKRSPNPA
jgi:Helicase associated domain